MTLLARSSDALALALDQHQVSPFRTTTGDGWWRTCSCGVEVRDGRESAHVATALIAAGNLVPTDALADDIGALKRVRETCGEDPPSLYVVARVVRALGALAEEGSR